MKWQTETLDFPTDEGTLHGEILLPNGEGPFPGAVLCHGMASGHLTMKPSAQRLARQGIATLIFDFRGHGKSEGFLDGDLAQDVIAATKFLRCHDKVNPKRIAIVGHSMGALAAIQAAATFENIRALVCLSSPAEISGHFTTLWAHFNTKAKQAGNPIIEFPRNGSLIIHGGLISMAARIWMWLRGYTLRVNVEEGPESLMKLNPLPYIDKIGDFPKLFVHCKGDRWLAYKEVHRLYEIAPPPKNYILSEGGFHSAPLFPGKLRGRWISWLVSVLT